MTARPATGRAGSAATEATYSSRAAGWAGFTLALLAVVNFIIAMVCTAPHIAGILSAALLLSGALFYFGSMLKVDRTLADPGNRIMDIGFMLGFGGLSLGLFLYGAGVLSLLWSLALGFGLLVVCVFVAGYLAPPEENSGSQPAQ